MASYTDELRAAVDAVDESTPLTQKITHASTTYGHTAFQPFLIPLIELAQSLERRVGQLEGFTDQLNQRVSELEREADGG